MYQEFPNLQGNTGSWRPYEFASPSPRAIGPHERSRTLHHRLIVAVLMLSIPLLLPSAISAATPTDPSVAPVESWPCWRGPYGNGSTGVPKVPLVENLTQARLV